MSASVGLSAISIVLDVQRPQVLTQLLRQGTGLVMHAELHQIGGHVQGSHQLVHAARKFAQHAQVSASRCKHRLHLAAQRALPLPQLSRRHRRVSRLCGGSG